MNYIIRKLRPEEVKMLDTFLYEAIFIPEGVEAPPMESSQRDKLCANYKCCKTSKYKTPWMLASKVFFICAVL